MLNTIKQLTTGKAKALLTNRLPAMRARLHFLISALTAVAETIGG